MDEEHCLLGCFHGGINDRYLLRLCTVSVMDLRVPNKVGKVLASCTSGGLSRRAQLHAVRHETEHLLKLYNSL
jgi:hypothetical protein